jgi:hypothetical protein
VTAAPSDHIHISEREPDGSWEDCTWDSGLEWYRLVYDPRKPATHAEAQLLRRASGEPATGGSNLGDLARGIRARYGTSIPARISGFATLKATLSPGKVAVVQGSMSAFGPNHRLSEYDRNFDGAHAVVVMNIDGVLLWCDPEAPTKADVPVTVTWAEVERYVKALNGQHVVGPIKTLTTKEANVPLITYLPGYTANVKAGSNVRSEPRIASTKLHATTAKLPVQVVGTVKGSVDPANGSDIWYELWHEGRTEYTAKDNIVDLKAPAVAVDPTAAVAAAVAPLKLTIDQQAALIAELKTEVVSISTLRAALKAFLG